jgi:sulfide:quinone oxidoreductase
MLDRTDPPANRVGRGPGARLSAERDPWISLMTGARRRGTLGRMATHTGEQERPRVLVAGGGVAALEACLFLRAYVSDDDVAIDLLTPAPVFSYRPLSVLEAFGGAQSWSMRLERFAADQDATLVHDALAAVDGERREIVTTSGVRCPYDLLLVAIGARPTPQLPGAVTFQGSADTPALRRVLEDAADRLRPRIAFAVGPGTSWPLPLYELALLTANELRARGARCEITLVTPEAAPLELFGPRAGEVVARLLDDHGITVVLGAEPLSAEPGVLHLADGRSIGADRVLALPRAAGRFVEGLPHDPAGFVPVDPHGRVEGVDAVYAAGDITTFPFKQGGLATQQADAAAEAILADLGLAIKPRPFSPVLQGVLYSGGDPTYMSHRLGGDAGGSSPRSYSLWWPPSKIAGRFLSSYLTVRGAPRAPEVRPASDVVPVRVDIGKALAEAGRVPVP